jgi:single-stranded-DNA-specific exonuclease
VKRCLPPKRLLTPTCATAISRRNPRGRGRGVLSDAGAAHLLRDKGWFDSRGIAVPNLAEYLDLVALGTVADVVPLDTNNRILTWQGLSRIRAGKCRPGIKALLEIANRDPLKLAASDLGFALGPRLNAAGRLDDMSVGVALLLCDNIGEARVLANELDALNQTRKEIEQGMQAEALTLCEKLERSGDTLPGGLAMYHPEWHQGVVAFWRRALKSASTAR